MKAEDILMKDKYKGLQNLVLICEAMEEFALQNLEQTVASYEIDRVNLVAMTLERDELDEKYKEAIKDRNAWQSEYRASRDQLERAKLDLEKKIQNKDKIMLEMGERFKAKMMSVFYLLNTIKKMGTHREKETAVRYLQQTIDDIIKGENDMSWDQQLFDIPF